MFFTKFRTYTDLAYHAFGFAKRNGVKQTISRIIFKLKRDKKYSYKSLRKKFAQRFTMPSKSLYKDETWATIIDSSAQLPMETVLKNLDIAQDPAQLLALLKKSFHENKYCRVLDDLFTLEEVLENITGKHQYPLIQTSGLPQLSKRHPKRSILFITSQVPSPYHGGGNRILNFLKILSEDNDIYLATAYYSQEDDDLLSHIGMYCRSIYKIPYWQFGNNQNEIRKWLDGKSMDIVHYEWPDSLNNQVPEIGGSHIFTYMEAVSLRLLMDLKRLPDLSTPWLDTLNQLVHALRTEISDTTSLTARIAVTTKDGSFFRDIYPYQEYAVLNHGVNLDEFSLPDVEPEARTLVFVGNYGHYPNIDAVSYFFREVWNEIRVKVPETRVYLVGPNPSDEIKRLADDPRIIVTGGVSDVRPYIQKATICIAPLITGAGLRGKVIEYAALRRTFIATSIATTDLAYRDGFDYLQADTASDFAQKVILLLKDGKLRQKMAGSAYETTRKNYDSRRLVDFLYRFYDHLELERQQT